MEELLRSDQFGPGTLPPARPSQVSSVSAQAVSAFRAALRWSRQIKRTILAPWPASLG